jgi:site-specific DNA-methyltransferase (adenine-specific)
MTIELLNIDCMEYMKGLEDNAFELAIVDPPYGIDWGKQTKSVNTGKNWIQHDYKDWDSSAPGSEYFFQIYRVSKNQIIWGANYFKEMKPTPCWVIWDKMQEFSGATFEMAWTSFKSPAKAFRMARCQAYVGVSKIHPTQKPVKLYEWLLQNYAKEGDKILDTHLGSGSSAIAAHYGGFDFVGCELDEDYYKAAKARFDNETAQRAMF